MELFAGEYIYVVVALLAAGGLFTLVVERHLLKKLVGLILFQTAVFVFFVAGAARDGATVPVLDPELSTDPQAFADPLPHLLVLTALVVGAAIVGVAASLLVRIHGAYGTLDDVELSNLPPDGVTGPDPAEAGQ